MAFLPEDGMGMVDSNSLVAVEYADTYFADRLNLTWQEATIESKQASLIKATAFLDTQYAFKGQKKFTDQGVSFPRKEMWGPDGVAVEGVPSCIQKAVCELAVRALTVELLPDPEFDESGRAIKSISESVGVLKRYVQYAGPGDLTDEAKYPVVDSLICSWMLMPKPMSYNVRLACPQVSGISNSAMQAVVRDTDRYTGPFNENGRDKGLDDVTII